MYYHLLGLYYGNYVDRGALKYLTVCKILQNPPYTLSILPAVSSRIFLLLSTGKYKLDYILNSICKDRGPIINMIRKSLKKYSIKDF